MTISTTDIADDIIHSIAWGIASKTLAKRMVTRHKISRVKRHFHRAELIFAYNYELAEKQSANSLPF